MFGNKKLEKRVEVLEEKITILEEIVVVLVQKQLPSMLEELLKKHDKKSTKRI